MFKVCRNCDGWIHLPDVGHTFLSVIPSVHFKHGNCFLFDAGGRGERGDRGQRGILNSIPLCPWSWLSFPLCTGSAHVWGPRPLWSLRNQSRRISLTPPHFYSLVMLTCQNTLISRVYFPLETWNVIFDLNVFPLLSTLPGSWRTLTYIIIITMIRTAKMY